MKGILFFLVILIVNTNSLQAQKKVNNNFNEISRQQNAYYDSAGKDQPGYKQFKRWEWYYSTRLNTDGTLPDNHKLKLDAARNTLFNQNQNTNLIQANTGGWTQLGPKNVNSADNGIGRANRIAFHPTDPDKLYLAGATGGLWISSDGGQNWFSYTEGIPNMSLSGVAVDYTNPNIIYILTGDADDGGGTNTYNLGKPSIGVLKSYDGGFTWNTTGLSFDEENHILGYKLIMHPTNPLILLVASDNGIYRTTDGGNTWTLDNLLPTVFDIEFHPTNPAIVYASGKNASNIGVLKSTDNGMSFITSFTMPKAVNAAGNPSTNRTALAVSAANSNYVYLLAGPATDTGVFHGFYRSTDSGDNFSLRTNTPNILGNTSNGLNTKDQEWYDMAVAVSPTDINKVACGAIRLWTSVNGGSNFTWQDDKASAANYYHPDIHDLVYHPLNNSILYMIGDGGIYRSNDDGNSWTDLNNNLQLTQYYKISANPNSGAANENIIIGGTQDNGTNKRSLAGGTFTQIYHSDGMDCYIDPDNTNHYVASTQNGSFFYSDNAGSSFENICDINSISAALGVSVTSAWVTPVAEISGNANSSFVMGYKPTVLASRIFAGNYVFTNLGWSGLTFIKTARGNANRIYIGDNDAQSRNVVKTSTDLGNTWTEIYDGPNTNKRLTDLAFAPNNGNRIWLTFGGFGSTGKVIYTSNGGSNGGTWTDITGSLPAVPINCIIYDPNGTSIDAIYVGTDIGVFYRDNNLGDWIPFSNGLPVIEVTDLEIHPTLGVLRAGTYGRGIWESPLYSNCVSTITLNTGNTELYKPYYFQASNSISSEAKHKGTGANVFYKAGTEIILSPGFESSGNIFKATIGPCGGGVPSGKQAFPLKGFLKQ